MDITFDTEAGRFNYRVGAIIISNNKVLLAKNEKIAYHYSVGGRVKMNESADAAVVRESKEELGIDLEIDRLGFVVENFLIDRKGVHFHGLAFYYYMKHSPDLANIRTSFQDVNRAHTASTHHLHWIDIEKLDKYYIYPAFFKSELARPSNYIKHIIERR